VATHDVSEINQLTHSDLDEVRTLRAKVRAIFDAPDDHTAARAINALVAKSAVIPRLTDHDGYDWHMHYFSPGASLCEHLAADCGMALAHVISAGERERLRRCEAPDCDQVLVDLSRNRSKRYCDARTCGNRLHVAAYRERRRAEATG
jgi:predicted RNA-binding Zn ribbon-like protein